MVSLHATPHAARLVLGTLAALVLLAAMSAVAASTPISSDQFAPGWQDRAKPLYNMGKAQVVDRYKWYVPGILPRGEYVLVQRDGNKAEVIDGYRFTVKGNIAEQYIFVAPGYSNIEALPVADIPTLKPQAPTGAAALQ